MLLAAGGTDPALPASGGDAERSRESVQGRWLFDAEQTFQFMAPQLTDPSPAGRANARRYYGQVMAQVELRQDGSYTLQFDSPVDGIHLAASGFYLVYDGSVVLVPDVAPGRPAADEKAWPLEWYGSLLGYRSIWYDRSGQQQYIVFMFRRVSR